MTRPRVLLVDDDASIRRFAELALEDLEIALTCVGSVAEALAELRAHGPAALVLTDLMMPAESGFDLIRTLEATPALRGTARIVVFSAGAEGGSETLAGRDVWRRLGKPVSVAALQACVREAVAGGAQPGGRHGAESGTDAPLTPDESRAIEQHFGGERALYLAFRATCLPQFARDAQAGEQAHDGGDLAALRLLAHSLKSVLATLGHDALASIARELERACAAGGRDGARRLWPPLRHGLVELAGGNEPG